jgi:hypothetical protein
MPFLASQRIALPKSFAFSFAAAAACFVVAGFTRTFFLPLVAGTFSRPWFVYVHACLFFSWIALLVAQALLAARPPMKWHRRLGWVGTAMLLPMAASGVMVAYWSTRRDIVAGEAAEALPFFFGLIMDMVLFASLAVAAVLVRSQTQAHKRLMLLATVAILGAAIGRIPVVGAFANHISVLFVLSIGVGDLWTSRQIHRATALGGAWLLIGMFSEGPIGSTDAWISVARRLVGDGP